VKIEIAAPSQLIVYKANTAEANVITECISAIQHFVPTFAAVDSFVDFAGADFDNPTHGRVDEEDIVEATLCKRRICKRVPLRALRKCRNRKTNDVKPKQEKSEATHQLTSF
jgi:hypothetical protein